MSANIYSQSSGTIPSSAIINAIVKETSPSSVDIRGPNGPYKIGQRWINSTSNLSYTLTSYSTSNGEISANWLAEGPGSGALNQISANTGIAVPSSGNINIVGSSLFETSAVGNTITINPTSDGYPITPYVVGPNGSAGYQTIQSAIDAANANGGGIIYIQPGFYTENLTLSNNIYLSSIQPTQSFSVIINGSITATDLTSNFGLNHISIQTSGANPCLSVTGSVSASVGCSIFGCTFNSSGGSAIECSASGSYTLNVNIENSQLDGNQGCIVLSGSTGLSLRYSSVNASNLSSIDLSDTSNITVFYSIINSGDVGVILNDSGCQAVLINIFGSFVNEVAQFNAAATFIMVTAGFSCNATSGNFIAGSSGTFIHGYIAVLGTATGIEAGITQVVVNQLVHSTAGDSSTSVRGTASFNSNEFNVTNGFVSSASTASSSISSGTGTVKMASTNSSNNDAWILMNVGGTNYYVPAWTTNAP